MKLNVNPYYIHSTQERSWTRIKNKKYFKILGVVNEFHSVNLTSSTFYKSRSSKSKNLSASNSLSASVNSCKFSLKNVDFLQINYFSSEFPSLFARVLKRVNVQKKIESYQTHIDKSFVVGLIRHNKLKCLHLTLPDRVLYLKKFFTSFSRYKNLENFYFEPIPSSTFHQTFDEYALNIEKIKSLKYLAYTFRNLLTQKIKLGEKIFFLTHIKELELKFLYSQGYRLETEANLSSLENLEKLKIYFENLYTPIILGDQVASNLKDLDFTIYNLREKQSEFINLIKSISNVQRFRFNSINSFPKKILKEIMSIVASFKKLKDFEAVNEPFDGYEDILVKLIQNNIESLEKFYYFNTQPHRFFTFHLNFFMELQGKNCLRKLRLESVQIAEKAIPQLTNVLSLNPTLEELIFDFEATKYNQKDISNLWSPLGKMEFLRKLHLKILYITESCANSYLDSLANSLAQIKGLNSFELTICKNFNNGLFEKIQNFISPPNSINSSCKNLFLNLQYHKNLEVFSFEVETFSNFDLKNLEILSINMKKFWKYLKEFKLILNEGAINVEIENIEPLVQEAKKLPNLAVFSLTISKLYDVEPLNEYGFHAILAENPNIQENEFFFLTGYE